MLTPEQDFSRKVACDLRALGLNPLPSREDEKRPYMEKYSHLWDTMAPPELFTESGWPATRNLQVVCGVAWGLFAIDLDGEEAVEEWRRWCQGRYMPETWVTHSGGGGRHVWFRLPPGRTKPLPKAELWRPSFPGPRVKGEPAIERLGDRSLVVFPPSIHPRTRRRYVFDNPRCKPPRMLLPAFAPRWVLDLEPLRHEAPAPVVAPVKRPPVGTDGSALGRDEVLSRIHDKIGLVQSWGVRIAGRPRDSGWVPCKAIDREDRSPSAAVHAGSGSYHDSGSGRNLSLFDLMIALGRAADFQDAKARLADQFR